MLRRFGQLHLGVIIRWSRSAYITYCLFTSSRVLKQCYGLPRWQLQLLRPALLQSASIRVVGWLWRRHLRWAVPALQDW